MWDRDCEFVHKAMFPPICPNTIHNSHKGKPAFGPLVPTRPTSIHRLASALMSGVNWCFDAVNDGLFPLIEKGSKLDDFTVDNRDLTIHPLSKEQIMGCNKRGNPRLLNERIQCLENIV